MNITFTPELSKGTFKENSTFMIKQHWVAEWQEYRAIGITRDEAFERLIELMQTRSNTNGSA